MSLKTVILCGGKGTRLGEVTGETVPKPMVRIGEQPILWHLMRGFSHFGHRDFVLCAGHLSWAIKSYFLNFHARLSDVTIQTGRYDGVKFNDHTVTDDWQVTIAETGLDTMTAGRIKRIARYLEPGEDFFVTYGDGLSNVDLEALLAFHRDHGRLATMTGVIAPGRFGEIGLEGDHVVEWAEKPLVSDRYINGGFMVFKREFVDRFIDDDSDHIMLEREPLIRATEAGELMLYRHSGFWQCMDTMRDWQLLNALWDAGEAPWG